MLKKIFILIYIIKYNCHADAPAGLFDISPQIIDVPLIPSTCDTGNASVNNKRQQRHQLEFRLPFMDMEIQTERNLLLLHEPEEQLKFILHGNELYQLFVSRQEKRLAHLGALAGSLSELEPIAVAVLSWHNYLLIAVALDETLEIYQISKVNIAQRTEYVAKNPKSGHEGALIFEPIQQLRMPGKFRKVYLTKPSETEEKVMLLLAVNFTKLYGKYKTYEWLDTYFNPIDEITVPHIHVLHLIGTYPKYLISGRTIRSQPKMILSIYEVEVPSLKFRLRQTLTVNSRSMHVATFRNRNYMIACSTPQQSSCNIFRMSDGQFNAYKNVASKDLVFDKFTAGKHLLVAARHGDILVFTSARLDCYSSFTANATDVTDIVTHNNVESETFIVLWYKRPFHTLLRMVEVVAAVDGAMLGSTAANFTEQEDLNALQSHRHQFEQTIGALRSILLRRKNAMDVFRRIAHKKQTAKTVKLQSPVVLEGGSVDRVQIVNANVLTPIQLLERIAKIRRDILSSRRPRSFGVGNVSPDTLQTLKVKRLHVENLIYDGDVLPGYHLDNLTQPTPILSIRPQLTTTTLQTQKLLTRQNYNLTRQVAALPRTKQRVRQLHVQRINNISWFEFYNELFLRDRDTKIQGRLILQSTANIVNLKTPLLNGLVVDQLFNLKQPQVVQSNIAMSAFFVSSLEAERVNGLDFANDIIFSGRDSFIETPVKMQQITIAGNIYFTDDKKLERDGDIQTLELQQFYTGQIIINGSLTVNNLLRESITTKILINGREFLEKPIQEQYLLSETPQFFRTPIIFGNAKVTTTQLTTNYINDHRTSDHLLATGAGISNSSKPLFLVFMNATVERNVICKDGNSKLKLICSDTVRHGEVANITGFKQFEGGLKVDELMTLSINRLSIDDLVKKSQLFGNVAFRDTKSFETLKVSKTSNVTEQLNSNTLNNLPLDELLNYDYHLERLELPFTLEAVNIVFHNINGISFDDVFTKLSIRDDKLVLHKDLIIEGNVQFAENLFVETINGINWNDYEASLVRYNENARLEGKKTFLAEVTVTRELQTPAINQCKQLQQKFENILLKSTPQTISGAYSFNNLQLSNVDVTLINDMSTAAFIDTRQRKLIIESDLVVPKLIVHGDLQGRFNTDFSFENITTNLQKLQAKQWRNLVVLGDAFWNTSSKAYDQSQAQALLNYLHKNAVTRSGNQTISGNVKLQRPLITKMFTKTRFPPDIDIDAIAKDALLKNVPTLQTINARKIFTERLQFNDISVSGDLRTNTINTIDILRLNASLYRLSSGEPIIGPLRFINSPIIEQLTVDQNINGMSPSQIYHIQQTLPHAVKLKNLIIDNDLELGDINEMSLDYLLENRVPLHGEALEIFGTLSFENLILKNQIMLQTINGIPIDNMVYKKSQHLQAITGEKIIDGNLVFSGPAHVMRLNGKDLSESYQQSINTEHQYNIDTLVVDEATFEGGLVYDEPMDMLLGATKDNKREVINTIIRDLIEIENNTMKNTKKQHLLYMDYDLATDIVWQESSANITLTNTQYYPIKELSLCERLWLQVEISHDESRMYLKNITTNLITSSDQDLSVKAQNYCKTQHRQIKSKITFSKRNFTKPFGMKKYIQNIDIYTPNHREQQHFVMLHAIDLKNQGNEVRIFNMFNDNITDWQTITQGVGSKTMRLFKYTNLTMLIISGVINNHPALSIYLFEPATQMFKLKQIIDGDYDIIEFMHSKTVSNDHQLILSCQHCQRINIYRYKPLAEQVYQIFQIIKFQIRIDKLVTFSLSDDDSGYMLVVAENRQHFYHLYKYVHIQGWQQSTFGYFQNIEMALPLIERSSTEDAGDELSLLLCSSYKCGLVKAYVYYQ